MTKLDTLTVSATASDELQADGADLRVTVHGSVNVFSSAALRSAREVRQLVAELAPFGIDESAITLLSVETRVTSHLVGKTSAASYALQIRCARLDDVGAVVAVVARQKDIELGAITWTYRNLDALHDRLLGESLARAGVKAQVMAAALASCIGAVHRVSENLFDHEQSTPGFENEFLSRRPGSGPDAAAVDLGMAVSHSKRISVRAEVTYRIRPSGDRAAAERDEP